MLDPMDIFHEAVLKMYGANLVKASEEEMVLCFPSMHHATSWASTCEIESITRTEGAGGAGLKLSDPVVVTVDMTPPATPPRVIDPPLADEPHRNWVGHTFAILKTDTQMNPARPEGSEFYKRDQVAYVLRRDSGRLLIATSFGSLQLHVGEYYNFHHDQSGRSMGSLEVIGVKSFATGETVGDIPDRPVPHFVFK